MHKNKILYYMQRKSNFRKCSYPRSKNNIVRIGNSKFVNCKFCFNGFANCVLDIGDNNLFINVTFWFEDNGSEIIIGNNNRFAGSCQLAAMEKKKIVIGNNCLFSSNIFFRTSDSHSILSLDSKRINKAKDIIIGDHVWFGQNVYILKGTVLSSNSMVGCGSIVTKQFLESNLCIAGNPAKIIRNNIIWDTKR